MADRYAGGVWFVELATVIDPDRVPAAIAATLGERELAGDLVEAIVARASDRPTLVLLDNCEHLLDAVAALVDALLRRCPTLSFVATSREPLGVPGEIAWRTPSMPAPDPADSEPIEALAQFDAVRLFVDRATKVRPNFRLTDENAVAIARGVSPARRNPPRAGARGRPRQRAHDRAAGRGHRQPLPTPDGRRGTVSPCQQTLQASVDWSFDLLSELERVAFRRLAVFSGGFTLDAAESVVAGAGIQPVDILDLLRALVDKSMVDADPNLGRFRMLETMRQYATACLVDAAETEQVRDADLAWATGLFDPVEVLGSDRIDNGMLLDDEIDNLRAAFEWAALTGSADAAAELAIFFGVWETRRGDPRAAVAIAATRCSRCPICRLGSASSRDRRSPGRTTRSVTSRRPSTRSTRSCPRSRHWTRPSSTTTPDRCVSSRRRRR